MRIFKPYLKADIGVNPFVEYVIDDGKLTIKKKFGSSASINLPPDSHETVQNMAQKMADIGDVIVRKHGNELKCDKVSGVKAFVAALYENHEEGAKTAQPVYEFQDQVIVIPAMPSVIFNLMYEFKYDLPFVKETGEELGSIVDRGDIIVGYGGPDIGGMFGAATGGFFGLVKNHTLLRSPVKGRIEYLSPNGTSDIGRDFHRHDPHEASLIIRPVKDQIISDHATYDAFMGIVDWCDTFVKDPSNAKKLASKDWNSEKIKRLSKATSFLRSHKTDIFPSATPEVSGDQRAYTRPENLI